MLDGYKTAAGNTKVYVELTDKQLDNLARFYEKPVAELTVEDMQIGVAELIDSLYI